MEFETQYPPIHPSRIKGTNTYIEPYLAMVEVHLLCSTWMMVTLGGDLGSRVKKVVLGPKRLGPKN